MYYLVQNDNGERIKATLTENDSGTAVDLSESTPVMKFKAKGSATVLSTLSCVSTSAELLEGVAIFEFTSSDTDVDSGYYTGEIEVTFDDGKIRTVYEELDFYVRADY